MMLIRHAARWLAVINLVLIVMPPGAPRASETATVKIENFAFTPQDLAVKAGTAVTFENDDDVPHTIVAGDHSFRSKALDTRDRFTITFEKAGDFPYFCSLHPHMQGRIIVTP